MVDPSLRPVSEMGREAVLGTWVPSLPFVMRRRWIEVLEKDASWVYRSEEVPVEGKESSSGSLWRGLPELRVSYLKLINLRI